MHSHGSRPQLKALDLVPELHRTTKSSEGNLPHYKNLQDPLPACFHVSVPCVLAGKQQRRAQERLPDDYLLLLTCSLVYLVISAEEREFIPWFAFVFESRQQDIFRQRELVLIKTIFRKVTRL